jgi:hypothetical protein
MYFYRQVIHELKSDSKYNSCILAINYKQSVKNASFVNCVFSDYFSSNVTIEENVEIKNCCFASGTSAFILDMDSTSSLLCEGDIIGYKKCTYRGSYENSDFRIVKLLIPAKAKRCSATSNKCRAEYAVVLEILNVNGNKSKLNKVFSIHNPLFVYEIGRIVKPTSPFNSDRGKECTSGIHFFRTFKEAAEY